MWVAKYMRAEGTPTRKVLGPAWVKDSGRRTARGAVVWRTADGPKPDGHLTPKEAQEALAELMAAEKGRHVFAAKPGVRTLGDAFDEYVRHAEHEKDLSVGSLQSYRSVWQLHVLPVLPASTPLRRLDVSRLDLAMEKMAERGVSRGNRRMAHSVLSGTLARAVEKRWLPGNPMRDVKRPAPARKAAGIVFLQPEEVIAVAAAAEGDWLPETPRETLRQDGQRGAVSERQAERVTEARRYMAGLYASMIRVSAWTGLRAGELRALRWRDVDFAARSLRVERNMPTRLSPTEAGRTKGKRSRSLPLIDQAAAELARLRQREAWTFDDDLVFVNSAGGVVDHGGADKAFKRALVAAGVGKKLRWHDLRHSFATMAAAHGATLVEIKEWLGHASIETTMVYAHYLPKQDAADRLSRAFAVEVNPLAALETSSAAEGSEARP
ncbi:site-specific integrase [Conexibacter sp. SYSU D00693]|uniref:tyrosine-type recombinase/integrase n=1 Tax=Conexibacter sp. SYSU D00693 TaxID=2812560 RepID=UPI00196B1287|nr:site-specific integrase [Conexibacter sp. SYSU D00693]